MIQPQKLTELEAAVAVHAAVVETWVLIQFMYPSVGAMPTVLTTTRPSNVAGTAWNSTYNSRVEYNLTYPMTVGIDAFMELLVHELAHIVQFRLYRNAAQAHGPEFRSIMQMLGYPGNTYHQYDVVEAKAASTSARKARKVGISIAGIL